MKPIIGISCNYGYSVDSTTFSHQPKPNHSLGDSYVQAVERAGGIPLIIPNFTDAREMLDLVHRLDGLLVSGGVDVDSKLWGERAITEVTAFHPRRDVTESELIREAINHTDIPVLGICRGAQMLNVAMGGTLIQDLKKVGKLEHRMTMYDRNVPSHTVKIVPGSRLAAITGSDSAWVNSFHHQAVRDVAPGFVKVAESDPDGVTEAIELPGERFVLGVQWHPEGLTENDEAQAIFRALIKAAQK